MRCHAGAIAAAIGVLACSNEYAALTIAQAGGAGQGGGTGGASPATGVGAGGSGEGGTGGLAAGGSGGSAGSTTSASGGNGGGGPKSVEYIASVAACISYDAPNPEVCEAQVLPNEILVDTQEGNTGDPMGAFLRFDLDGALAGKTVTAVRLRVRVTQYMLGDSVETGEVFGVAPFTFDDLFNGVPGKVSAVLAPSQGPVAHLEIVDFPLPTSVAKPNAGLFLSIAPVSNDLVSYYNHETPDAPRLIVDYE
jgi:hypothetical protein